MDGLGNLTDAMLVFAVGLMLALASLLRLPPSASASGDALPAAEDAEGRLEVVLRDRDRLKRVRVTGDRTKGHGKRIGSLYRIEGGGLVYVPSGDKP